ncbi:TIR domain-containing protein [Reyranella massiliensis]|uniref:TIR domain-containing protein n=1 Tax=Reyranella massiliensis TaxID=445220 RepID=UPI0002E7D826|nr:TIR domain-containing protein [Reyranella massiliensis]
MKKKIKTPPKISEPKRDRLSQVDVPMYALDSAIRVPKAIADNYGSGAVTPLQLAAALDMSPSSGPFRSLCGAAIAYGLTNGGYNAQQIELQSLGRRITKPLTENDDQLAKREALQKPRVIGEFLKKYADSPLPRADIAVNVLQSMGVPADRADAVFSMIVEGAKAVGLIREIKGKQYIELGGVAPMQIEAGYDDSAAEDLEPMGGEAPPSPTAPIAPFQTGAAITPVINRRVFITHGKDKSFLDPIRKLLGFGEMIAVVSVEKQSVSKPVPDKVMDDMRSCSAAIIHVDAEDTFIDKEANERKILNPNVLIEIGAAMALYGRRFILLVRSGVELPSNLQGLYEVRYTGDALDGAATIKLLEAINDIKNNPIPERYKDGAA